MKLFKLILVLSLSLSFGSTLASDFECKKITGNVQLFPAGGGKCPILKKKARRFPDLTFLHELGIPQICFVGWMNGILGDTPITGKVISGLTANNLGGVFLTAASAIKIYEEENGNNLGRVFIHKIRYLILKVVKVIVIPENT